MSASIYPSIPDPGNTVDTILPSLLAVKQTLQMITMNAQNPNPNYAASSAAQIFVTHAQLKKTGIVGATGPAGPQGPPGVSGGVPEAPLDANTYGRHNAAWVAITTGGGGGISDAPNDGTTYARNSLAWQHLTHSDITDWAANIAQPATVTPVMDGTAAVGTSLLYARQDHVHPTDTSRYATSNPSNYQTAAQVTASLTPYALIASPTFTGIPAAPTATAGANTTQLATTAFVTAAVSTATGGGPFLPISGGTLTGTLTLAADPTVALGAATKEYVDNVNLDCGTY